MADDIYGFDFPEDWTDTEATLVGGLYSDHPELIGDTELTDMIEHTFFDSNAESEYWDIAIYLENEYGISYEDFLESWDWDMFHEYAGYQ